MTLRPKSGQACLWLVLLLAAACRFKSVIPSGAGATPADAGADRPGDLPVDAAAARADATLPDLPPLPPFDAASLPDLPIPTDAPEGRALGATCTAAEDCASGFCTDGVCCTGPCAGNCEACDEPGKTGQCAPVTGAPRGERAPCIAGGTPCGGRCDGQDGARCTYPGSDLECAPATCATGVATTASVCNGAGACLPGSKVSCEPFTCAGSICAGGCSASSPCVPEHFCDGGRCFPLRAPGAACGHPRECRGNACVDGRCCSKPACGTCESCTGDGGTCVKVTGKDDPGTCSGTRTCSPAGACQSRLGEACGNPNQCASSQCVSGRCCAVASCPTCASCTGGNGTCVPVGAGTAWDRLPGAAHDIDVAGSVAWVIGTNPVPGGFGIYRWNGTAWDQTDGGAVRVAVGPTGAPWVINGGGAIYRRGTAGWELMPGNAVDLDIGGDGSIWALGSGPMGADHGIYQWNGMTWVNVPGAATRIAVGPRGVPWVVTAAGVIYRRTGTMWEKVEGPPASSVDIGGDGTVWIVGTSAVAGGKGLFRYTGSSWAPVAGGAEAIGVGACLPWIADAAGAILRRR